MSKLVWVGVVLAAMAAAFIAATVALSSAPPAPTPVGAVADVILEADVAACAPANDEDCVQAAVTAALDRNGPAATSSAIVHLMREDESIGGLCHTALHWVGTRGADDYMGLLEQVRPTLAACGFGLLHGILENAKLPVDIDQARQAVSDICHTLEISPDPQVNALLATDCAHGVGHALGNTKVADTEYGYAVCNAAFAADRHLRGECINGNAMSAFAAPEFPVRTKIEEAPVDVTPPLTQYDEWAAPVCDGMGDLAAMYCAPAMLVLYVQSGPALEKGFLDWCKTRYPESANICYDSMGTAVTVGVRSWDWPIEKVAKEISDVCGTDVSDDNVAACWRGIANGLTQRGMDNATAIDRACELYDTMLDPAGSKKLCEQARTSVSERIIEPYSS